MKNFDKAFDLLCKMEGYNSNVKGDLGGRTIWGVSEKYFPLHVRAMAAMSAEESKQYAKEKVYRVLWNQFNCDLQKDKLDIAIFICAVNPGPGFVRRLRGFFDWKDILFEAQGYYNNEAADEKYEALCCMSGNCVKQKDRCDRKFLRGWNARVINLWRELK